MKLTFKPLLIAGLLATAGLTAFSMSPMAGGMDHDHMEGMSPMARMNPARMQARMDKHQAELKAKLKLSTEQEASWTTYASTLKPPVDMMAKKAQHDELAKLPTPERIDKMKALRSQHMAEMSLAMDKRGEATKVFYAGLTPEQKKIFDNASGARHAHKAPMEHMEHGGVGKGPAQAKP